jgi:hypothetical protein
VVSSERRRRRRGRAAGGAGGAGQQQRPNPRRVRVNRWWSRGRREAPRCRVVDGGERGGSKPASRGRRLGRRLPAADLAGVAVAAAASPGACACVRERGESSGGERPRVREITNNSVRS